MTAFDATSATLSRAGHMRQLLTLGLPLVGSHLGQLAIGLTDTVMLGWYGIDALAAITLGGTFFFVLFLFGSGFAWAVMPLVATFAAQDDQTGIRRVTRMGLWLSAIYAALALPVMIQAEPILRALGQSAEVSADAATYLRIAAWGIIPALGVMVIKSYLSALERTQAVLWIVLASAVVNGFCNWLLIFGNWGAPELGLAGAAWASIVTQTVMLVGVVIYARAALPQHDLFRRLWVADRPVLLRVFHLGWPIGLTTLSEVGLFSATALMMGWLGTVPLAAHGIAVQLASITFMFHLGISNAATIRAGNAFGRQDRDHLVRGAQAAIVLSLAFAMVTIAIFLMVPEELISIFMDPDDPKRPSILAIGVTLIAVAALFQLVDGAQVIALGLLRGVQDTRVPMLMAAFSYWIVGMPCSYAMGFVLGWDGPGVWLGLVVGLGCAAVLLMARFWGPVLRQVGRDA